jgi:hypothetical protein
LHDKIISDPGEMKSKGVLIIYLFSLVGAQMLACREPFYPNNVTGNPGFLVVDGFINAGNDRSFIRLTRTASLNDSNVITELQANVYVSDRFGGSFPLNELTDGYYGADHLGLVQGRSYKLNIQTSDGRSYVSDSFPVLSTPPIDSLSWKEDSVGVSIYAFTHDLTNQTKYYRWDYVETWRYDAGIATDIYWDGMQVLSIPPDQQIYSCWSNHRSANLILATTQNLTSDTINHQLISEVPSGSEKISVRYSILVNQYAITKEAFEYWMNLKTTTELSGSLFDPLPSQVIGNMHCLTNASESVLGYIGACTVSNMRIFIIRTALTGWYYQPYWIDCVQRNSTRDTVLASDPGLYSKLYNALLAPNHLLTLIDFPNSAYYIMAQSYCADCRVHGGSNQKPSFW